MGAGDIRSCWSREVFCPGLRSAEIMSPGGIFLLQKYIWALDSFLGDREESSLEIAYLR